MEGVREINMKDFLLGIQLYSVRDEMEADFEGTLKKVKALGYDGVEFAGLFDKKAADIKKMCEDIGLTPISAHVPFADMMADPDICGDYEKLSELSAEITRLEQLLQEYYEQLDEML